MRTSRRPGRRRFNAAVTGALAVGVFALAGCAAAAPAAPATPAASATDTADTAVAQADPAAPVQVLDGDCSALLSDADVSALLGADVSVQTGFIDAPSSNAVQTVGGLTCTWAEPVPATGVSLTAVVVGATAVPATMADDTTCYESSIGASTDMASACSFGVTAGPLWLTGVAATAAGTGEDDTRAVVSALSDAFTALDAAEPAAPTAAAVWPVTGCSDLSEAAGVPAVLQSPDLVVSDADSGGAERPAGITAAATAAGVIACSWYQTGEVSAGQSSGFNLEALPGGAWAQAQVQSLPGASVVDIPEVDLAVRVPMDEATTGVTEVLNVFDGVNWLQVSAPQPVEELAPAVTALVAALNAG